MLLSAATRPIARGVDVAGCGGGVMWACMVMEATLDARDRAAGGPTNGLHCASMGVGGCMGAAGGRCDDDTIETGRNSEARCGIKWGITRELEYMRCNGRPEPMVMMASIQSIQ